MKRIKIILVAIVVVFIFFVAYSLGRFVIFGFFETTSVTDKLLKAVDERDEDAIRELFSAAVYEQIDPIEFKNGLEFFLNSYEGESTHVGSGGFSITREFNGLFSWKTEQSHTIRVRFSEKDYHIIYKYQAGLLKKDTGIYSLGIISNDGEKTAIRSGRFGIYYPKWNENKENLKMEVFIEE